MTEKKKRGRKKKDPVDFVRPKCWVGKIRSLNAPSLYELEKIYFPNSFKRSKDGEAQNVGHFSKYSRGLNVPKPDLVARVENDYPSTAKWLEHEFWLLLRETPPSDDKLKVIMCDIRPLLVKYIGGKSTGSGFRSILNSSLMKYRWEVRNNPQIFLMPDLLKESIGLLVIMIDAEYKEQSIIYEDAFNSFVAILPAVIYNDFMNLRDDVYSLIENRFTRNNTRLIETLQSALGKEDEVKKIKRRFIVRFDN